MLKQRSLFSLIMSVLQQAIGYISLYFISRYMGPEPLGILSSALAFCMVFMSFSDLGYGLAHVKKVSEGQDLSKCIATFFTVKLVLTLLVGITVVLVYKYSEITGKKLPVPREYSIVFYIVLLSQVLGNIAKAFQFTFAARLEKVKEWTSIISAKFVTSIFKTLTAVTGLGVIFLAFSNLAGMITSFMIALWFFRKLPFGKPDLALFKEYTRFALPAFIIGLSSTLAVQLDKVFISYFSSVEQVGYYTAAQAIVRIVTFTSVIFVSLLLPTYSKYHAEGNVQGIRDLAERIERYISFPLMGIGVFIFIFSSPIQKVMLGDKFTPSALIMKLLVINSVLLILAQPYTSQLMGMNKIKLSTILSLVMLGLNILFYVILIPDHLHGSSFFGLGAAGAAAALLFSNLIGTSLFRFYAYRLSGSRPNYTIFIHMAGSLFVYGAMYKIFIDVLWLNTFWGLAGVAIIGGILYLLLLSLLGQFSRSDLNYYMSVISPRKMGNYVQGELKN